ncbi:GspE/PulE family protein [Roseiconus lacunae]|uniref:GspE/PulE family protein n=1 Tax=Roseiconus lacunae TaxID=2605694 RepID=UPI001E5BBF0C|nr:ATPase, T2SS/T4P/T4SS family [Roseiconus lacunae]MCD0459248.1 Flp pilus assembly complex ATPase component TadA [Roseiconus lacunae]
MQLSLAPFKRATGDASFATEMVKDCLTAALDCGASDVHLQPRRDCWEVSFRIDGVLHLARTFDRHPETDPVTRLMALANMPTYRGGAPQEGALRWQHADGKTREMRLGIFPTVHGNRAAIRVMEHCQSFRQLEKLGLDTVTRSELEAVCHARDGWLLVAGPAGSGKTTTLYACLSHIANADTHRSVLTIEDPIESVIDSISQSQVQHGGGLTLAAAMRAAVRQDAEVLLVSEIRDVETAETVLMASMTGHLCFSSTHAGSIGATLHRLVQMKLPTYAIRSGLRAVLCQRLLRRSCDQCDGIKTASERGPANANACPGCHGTGYRGRLPVAHLVDFQSHRVGAELFDALDQHRSADDLNRLLSESGNATLYDRAMELAGAGLTDAEEVFRVMGRQS